MPNLLPANAWGGVDLLAIFKASGPDLEQVPLAAGCRPRYCLYFISQTELESQVCHEELCWASVGSVFVDSVFIDGR
jgi:hypothetical protein